MLKTVLSQMKNGVVPVIKEPNSLSKVGDPAERAFLA